MILRVPQEGLLLGLRVAVLLLLGFGHGNLALNDLTINFVRRLAEHSLNCFSFFESHESEPSRHQRSVNHDHTLLYLSEATEKLAQRFFCRSCSETSNKYFPIEVIEKFWRYLPFIKRARVCDLVRVLNF